MSDYLETKVTGMDAEALVDLINSRIEDNPSVELFLRGGAVILRTWKVELDVSSHAGESED